VDSEAATTFNPFVDVFIILQTFIWLVGVIWKGVLAFPVCEDKNVPRVLIVLLRPA
jgi:hypothetical protein